MSIRKEIDKLKEHIENFHSITLELPSNDLATGAWQDNII
jgi:hypothetical protein